MIMKFYIVFLTQSLVTAYETEYSHDALGPKTFQETVQAHYAKAEIDTIEASKAQDFITAHPKALVLDVRTPPEFIEGHIENAINIDFRARDFRDQLSKLDRDTHYILHCKSGRRSAASLEIMKRLGFKRITHMKGGLDAWKAADLPVSRQ